jgi:hypothetical protein
MRDYLRDQMQREITRKEFLQILTGVMLSVFGFHNIIALLSGKSPVTQHILGEPTDGSKDGRHGFGSSRFGD